MHTISEKKKRAIVLLVLFLLHFFLIYKNYNIKIFIENFFSNFQTEAIYANAESIAEIFFWFINLSLIILYWIKRKIITDFIFNFFKNF